MWGLLWSLPRRGHPWWSQSGLFTVVGPVAAVTSRSALIAVSLGPLSIWKPGETLPDDHPGSLHAGSPLSHGASLMNQKRCAGLSEGLNLPSQGLGSSEALRSESDVLTPLPTSARIAEHPQGVTGHPTLMDWPTSAAPGSYSMSWRGQ